MRVGVEMMLEAASDPAVEQPPLHIARESRVPRPAATATAAAVVEPRPAVGRVREAATDSRPVWKLDKREIREIADPTERVMARFTQALVGQDGNRLFTRLGARYLMRQHGRAADEPSTFFSVGKELEDQDEALQELGMHLVRRPFVQALRELPIARDFEVGLENFKAENIPLSGAYQEAHGDGKRRWGRVSLRWRYRDGSDPLSVTWVCSGWRLGASRETVRLGFDTPIAKGLRLHTSSSFDHTRDRFEFSAALDFDLRATTRLRLIAGNAVNAFPGSDIDRIVEGSVESGSGAMLWVETIF